MSIQELFVFGLSVEVIFTSFRTPVKNRNTRRGHPNKFQVPGY